MSVLLGPKRDASDEGVALESFLRARTVQRGDLVCVKLPDGFAIGRCDVASPDNLVLKPSRGYSSGGEPSLQESPWVCPYVVRDVRVVSPRDAYEMEWDYYEKQESYLMMPPPLPGSGIDVKNFMRSRRIGEFAVKIFAEKGSFGELRFWERPWVTEIEPKVFYETVVKPWADMPYKASRGDSRDKYCHSEGEYHLLTKEHFYEHSFYLNSFLYARQGLDFPDLPHVYVVAFRDDKPVAMADVSWWEGNSKPVYVDYLESKYAGGGAAVLAGVECLARNMEQQMIHLTSLNSVLSKSQEECKLLIPGKFASLNLFYKKEGYYDFNNACAVENVGQGPIRREEGPMSKCLVTRSSRWHTDICRDSQKNSVWLKFTRGAAFCPRVELLARRGFFRDVSVPVSILMKDISEPTKDEASDNFAILLFDACQRTFRSDRFTGARAKKHDLDLLGIVLPLVQQDILRHPIFTSLALEALGDGIGKKNAFLAFCMSKFPDYNWAQFA
jgi:hypothetical protein